MRVRQDISVALPSQLKVEQKLLLYLHGFQRWLEPLSVYGPLADTLKLTTVQRHARRPNRKEAAWENLVQCAREGLVRKGLLDGSRHGQWRLTAEGHAQAEKFLSFDPTGHGL